MCLLLSAFLTVSHEGSAVILDQIEMRFEPSTIWLVHGFTTSNTRQAQGHNHLCWAELHQELHLQKNTVLLERYICLYVLHDGVQFKKETDLDLSNVIQLGMRTGTPSAARFTNLITNHIKSGHGTL